jgi:hypothetical protein
VPKKRKKQSKGPSSLERKFFNCWAEEYPHDLPLREYKFHPTKQWRFDYAWPMKKIAVEIQGMGPGHCSLPGMTADHEKHLEAMILNWKVIYFTTLSLKNEHRTKFFNKLAQLLDINQNYDKPRYTPYRRR